jgi:hypothetical protein
VYRLKQSHARVPPKETTAKNAKRAKKSTRQGRRLARPAAAPPPLRGAAHAEGVGA